jgi:ribosomal protein S18 acetylase RimI-like enzyme
VIEHEGQPIGRLYIDRTPEEIHLIDIALLADHRGHGLGTALIREILAEADRTRRSIRLYVEHFNPARRLYDRFGFTEIEEHGPYWCLEWRPAAPPSAQP